MDLSDRRARQEALDPQVSCIVQAPAGAGKTTLLTRRYLALLACVAQPEEILCLTFTIKATAEMRSRILDLLRAAADLRQPPGADEADLQLAWRALERSDALGWNLMANTARLKIQTIDAFAAHVARQSPVAALLGALPDVTEDTTALFEEALADLLGGLEHDSDATPALERLTQRFDNRIERIEELLLGMLVRRDQWLAAFGELRAGTATDPAAVRRYLEQGLGAVIDAALARARSTITLPAMRELGPLLQWSAAHQENVEPDVAAGLERLTPYPDNLAVWRFAADLLLTQKGDVRRSVTIRQGFPPPASSAEAADTKQRMTDLLGTIGGSADALAALRALRELPDPRYADTDWRDLHDLVQLLFLAAAHLNVAFARHGRCDFTAVALAAAEALGEDELPTDLALKLDYQIRHVLIDEFQDTSSIQIALVEALIRGWNAGDGRTLFLVGDPMQSIYRFRNAEVALFLQARRYGIGEVRLKDLRLKVNFRSDRRIIEAVNSLMADVFPQADDPESGAISYSAFDPAPAAGSTGAFSVELFDAAPRDRQAEAHRAADITEATLVRDPDADVAILVRNRSHLTAIVDELEARNVAYSAVEIDPLVRNPAILDLLSLTRALLHPADQTHWLAVLRSPLVGIELAGLARLAGIAPGSRSGITALLRRDPERALAVLDPDDANRLGRALPAIQAALERFDRAPLRQWVEETWLALGGPVTLAGPASRTSVASFLSLLDQFDVHTPAATIEAAAQRRFVQEESAARVQLMTIHRAKGLEFDTVVLPGIDRPPRGDDPRLIEWDLAVQGDERRLLVSPISLSDDGENPTYRFLKRREARRGAHETTRLLYVAMTRAKRSLHLLGNAAPDGELSGRRGSLLSLLAPVVAPMAQWPDRELPGQLALVGLPERPPATQHVPANPVRFPAWPMPRPEITRDEPDETPDTATAAGGPAAAIGTVTHRALQRMHTDGLWTHDRIDRQLPFWRATLAEAGVYESELEQAVTTVRAHIERVIDDPTATWLFERRDGAAAEMPLAIRAPDGSVRRSVIDRTFVAEGVRWIIDFKSAQPRDAEPRAEFIERQKTLYAGQLAAYANLFAHSSLPVRCALYLTALPELAVYEEAPGA